MPNSMKIAPAAIRTALHTTLQTAHAPKKIYDGDPFKVSKGAALPYSSVQLQYPLNPERSGQGAGAKDVIIPHSYLLTTLFARPTGNVVLELYKESVLQALLDQIKTDETADQRYAGWAYDIESVDASAADDETEEPYCVVQLLITLKVITYA